MSTASPRHNRPERLTSDDDLFVRMEHALGLPVVNQVFWRLPGQFDRSRFEAIASRLKQGRLSRLIVRTPFPLRDRWIHTADAGRHDYADEPIAAGDCLNWALTQLTSEINSLSGPSWRLSAAPSADTDETFVSWVGSHSIGDGGAIITGIEEACADTHFDTTNISPSVTDTLSEGASSLRASADAAWHLIRGKSASGGAVAPQSPPVNRTVRWSGTNPSLVVSVPADEFDAAAARIGGTANSLFTAIVLGILESTGRVHEGQEIPVSLPMSTRTPDDRRANATTGVTASVLVDSGRYQDLTPIRVASKAAYRQPESGPGALALLGTLAQPMGDGIVRKLAADSRAPLCLASNLGVLTDSFAGLGGDPGRVAMRSMTSGASLDTMRRMAGGISGWLSRSAGAITLCVTALDPDRVPDTETLSGLMSDELGKWGLPTTFWAASS